MRNTPFFSIVIPTLNEEKSLPNIMKAISKQSYTDFEVIIVDAHSEDGTVTIAQTYQKIFPSIRILNSKKRNDSIQRNLGGSAARGKFIIFFDADIVIPDEFLAEIGTRIARRKEKFFTTWFEGDSSEASDQLLTFMININMEIGKAIGKPIAWGLNMIVSKEVFQEIKGFNEELTFGEDYDFTVRAWKAGYELRILKEPKAVMSLRRYRSQGKLHVMRMQAEASLQMILKGSIDQEEFDYPMGGHVHGEKKRSGFKSQKFTHRIMKYLAE
jgi:glycosyltransferase involved in cell wall biosynthesis